jgi:hypothetical protein
MLPMVAPFPSVAESHPPLAALLDNQRGLLILDRAVQYRRKRVDYACDAGFRPELDARNF